MYMRCCTDRRIALMRQLPRKDAPYTHSSIQVQVLNFPNRDLERALSELQPGHNTLAVFCNQADIRIFDCNISGGSSNSHDRVQVCSCGAGVAPLGDAGKYYQAVSTYDLLLASQDSVCCYPRASRPYVAANSLSKQAEIGCPY